MQCECCDNTVNKLVKHHFRELSTKTHEFHMICNSCNLILRTDRVLDTPIRHWLMINNFGHTHNHQLPRWELQREFVRAYRYDHSFYNDVSIGESNDCSLRMDSQLHQIIKTIFLEYSKEILGE